MSDEDRILNQDETRQVIEYADKYFEGVAGGALEGDPILDPLDLAILQSEPMMTHDTVNGLAYLRQRDQHRDRFPADVARKVAADQAMDDLDECLRQNVRDTFPLSTKPTINPDDVLGPGAEARRAKAEEEHEAAVQRHREGIADTFNGRGRRPRQGFGG